MEKPFCDLLQSEAPNEGKLTVSGDQMQGEACLSDNEHDPGCQLTPFNYFPSGPKNKTQRQQKMLFKNVLGAWLYHN